MSLQFIFGSCGSGKTSTFYNNIIKDSLDEPDGNYMAIVPEQFSSEARRGMIYAHPNHGFMNIDVLSFKRLAYRLFEEQNISMPDELDMLGQCLVLRKVMENCKNELKIYSSKISMQGFVSEMQSTITTLMQYEITDEKLKQMNILAKDRPVIARKVKDVEVIYNGFMQYTKDKYTTIEGMLNILCDVIENSELIKKSSIYFDGFTGFTPIQYKIIKALLKTAKKVVFTITLPKDEIEFSQIKEYELFSLSKKTIQKLTELANDTKTKIENQIVLYEDVPYRFKNNEEIAHLEKNIFRKNPEKYKSDCKNISVSHADTPKAEAEYVCFEILRLVREEHYKFEDIAIISGNMDAYYRHFEHEMAMCKIPAFIDKKHALPGNPYVEIINAALLVIENNFAYDNVFNFLKLGVTDIPRSDIDILENYVLERGIRGYNKYNLQWDYDEKYADLNEIKNRFLEIIKPLKDALTKKGTVLEYAKGVYEFIEKLNIEQKLSEKESMFERNGDFARAKEYGQVYAVIINLLDKMVSMLGTEIVSLKEFRQILMEGFNNILIGTIPTGIDRVVLGDIERTRLGNKKILFLVGVNEGAIPKAGVSNGIFCDSDKEFFKENDIELGTTLKEDAFIQRFYLYMVLTKASDKLYISYSKSNNNGESVKKSYLINVIKRIYPCLLEKECDYIASVTHGVVNEKTGLRYLAGELNLYATGHDFSPFARELFAKLKSDEEYVETLNELVYAAFYSVSNEMLGGVLAEKLYGKKSIGITRLERYAGCAYRQFLANGLMLVPRKEYTLNSMDMGNIYHFAIKMFSEEISERKIKWHDITKNIKDELVSKCVKTAVEEYVFKGKLESARSAYVVKRMERILGKTVEVLCEHIKRGSFEPYIIEAKGAHGIIDRVDICQNEDKVYVKIIDYKSGDKKVSLEDIFYGLQLQLSMYMKDAMKLISIQNPDKEVIPAGIYYYTFKDEFTENSELSKNMSQDDIEEIKLSHYKMSGITNVTDDAYKFIDGKCFANKEDSNVVEISFTKNNSFTSKSKVVSNEDFNNLLKYVENKSKAMESEILQGCIEINPGVKGNRKPCDYCEFAEICSMSLEFMKDERQLKSIKSDEFWDLIKDDGKE